MRNRALASVCGLGAVMITLGQLSISAELETAAPWSAAAGATFTPTGGSIGPDVIVGALPATVRWSTDATETSYSIATTSCNVGDEDLDWIAAPSNRHPVIGQNLFRLKDGRFEHIGQSWLKHSFCAIQLPLAGCGTCAASGGCISILTPGCSDPYTAARNGDQQRLGPKWEVNPHTGVYPVPFDEGEGTAGDFRRRLRVLNVDLDPALNPGAKYFIEGQYVTQDDAAAGNQNNNASYAQVTINPTTFNMTVVGETQQQKPGIQAWADSDAAVSVAEAQVPDDGLFMLGSTVTDNGDGTWDYEYALYNMNADRAARSFSVPVGAGVEVLSTGFHDVDYHSGEAWESTDWPLPETGIGHDALTFETDAYSDNELANAVRWGTIYNFRFTADGGPTDVEASIGLFKPGAPAEIVVATVGPGAVTGVCAADFDATGSVGFADLVQVLSFWGCAGCPEDLDASGVVDFADLIAVLAAWGPCP